jgi:superkiller protein 3
MKNRVAALLVLVLASAAARAQEADLDALLSRAVVLHQTGDLEGAVALYVQVLRAAPGASRVRSNLGAAYAGLGRYEEAIAEYRRALEGVDDVSIRQNLALSLQKGGRLEEAAEEASRVVAAQPENRATALLLADTRLRLGQAEKVLEQLAPVVAASPSDKAAAYLLGSALLALDRTAEAQAVMNQVFADDSAEAHVLLGSMYSRRQQYDEAIQELGKARTVNPKLPLVNFLYGRCLMERSDWAGAAAAFRQELEIDPNHFESNLMLGNLLREGGNHEEAVRYLTHALRLRASDLTVKYSLGVAYLSLGRLDAARPLLEEVEGAAPDHLPTHMQLAVLYVRLGRTEDAARERATAARLQKDVDARGVQGGRERLIDLLGQSSPTPPKQP